MRRLTSAVQFPDRRTTLLVLIGALALAALSFYLGFDVWDAILLAAGVTVIVLALLSISRETQDGRDLNWRFQERANRVGARDDILNLSWSLRAGWGYVGRTAELKLRQLARRRLALEGLELNDPAHRGAIEARIGAPAYAVLTREDVSGLRLSMMTRLMDHLDAIDPDHYPPPQPPQPRFSFRANPSRQRGSH